MPCRAAVGTGDQELLRRFGERLHPSQFRAARRLSRRPSNPRPVRRIIVAATALTAEACSGAALQADGRGGQSQRHGEHREPWHGIGCQGGGGEHGGQEGDRAAGEPRVRNVAGHLILLGAGQPVLAAAVIAVGLYHRVPDRLSRRLEFGRRLLSWWSGLEFTSSTTTTWWRPRPATRSCRSWTCSRRAGTSACM